MKAFLLLVSFVLILGSGVNAQNSSENRRDRIVVDSSGMKYPYALWRKMVESKQYKLKKIKSGADSGTYLIVKLDSAQVDRRMSKLPEPGASEAFADNQKVSLFNATDINGFKIKKKDLAGKIIVLNFWFMGCSPCRKEFPELNDLAIKYAADPDVIFIAISLDHQADIVPFLKTHPLSYHIIGDGREYAEEYGVDKYPTNVVIDRTGKVKFQSMSYNVATAYWIKKTIEELKAGS